MLSRERVRKAIRFEEPDRVPLDLGGSVFLTGICAGAYNALKNHLGFPELPTEVWDPVTMTVRVEEPIRRRLGLDVVCLTVRAMQFGRNHEHYTTWHLPSDGTKVRMPPTFAVTQTQDGGYMLRAPWPLYMPKGGHYFDHAHPSGAGLLDAVDMTLKKPDLKAMRAQSGAYPPTSEAEVFLRDEARHYHHNTDYALLDEWIGIGLPTGESIAGLTNAIMLMREDPDYVHEWFDILAEGAVRRIP